MCDEKGVQLYSNHFTLEIIEVFSFLRKYVFSKKHFGVLTRTLYTPNMIASNSNVPEKNKS